MQLSLHTSGILLTADQIVAKGRAHLNSYSFF